MLDFKNINEFLNVTYKIHANGELISSQHLIIDSLNPKEEKWFDLNVPNIPNGICTILFECFECIKNIKCVLAGNFLLVIPRCSRTDLVLSRQKLHRKDA